MAYRLNSSFGELRKASSLMTKACNTQHFLAPHDAILSSLSSMVGLSCSLLSELVEFGAVYVNKKRVLVDVEVNQGDYVRVHAAPRRYPKVYTVDWGQVVIENRLDNSQLPFVVVNKPAGIPVHSTVDNVQETLLACVQQQIQRNSLLHAHLDKDFSLQAPHRLDVDTAGLMILTSGELSLRYFGRLFREGRVHRSYRALLTSARADVVENLQEGQHLVHYTPTRAKWKRAPRVFAAPVGGDGTSNACPSSGWKRCELIVEKAQSVRRRWDAESAGDETCAHAADDPTPSYLDLEAAIAPLPLASAGHMQEVQLKLLTGRTHQIRGQLACAGLPVVGDRMYPFPEFSIAEGWESKEEVERMDCAVDLDNEQEGAEKEEDEEQEQEQEQEDEEGEQEGEQQQQLCDAYFERKLLQAQQAGGKCAESPWLALEAFELVFPSPVLPLDASMAQVEAALGDAAGRKRQKRWRRRKKKGREIRQTDHVVQPLEECYHRFRTGKSWWADHVVPISHPPAAASCR
jgi:23S rRNA-/tRNA-specific pseudouridylate synthase